jgi:hypothetical protein
MFFVWLLRLYSWLLLAGALLVPTFLYWLVPLLNINQAITVGAGGLFLSALCGTLTFIASHLKSLAHDRDKSKQGGSSYFDF